MTNSYILLQELINKVYVLIINMPYTKVDFNENLCIKIISEVNNSFKAKEYMTLEEKITDYFYNIEGVPESLRNKVSAYEACLEEISRNHKKLVSDIMLENIYTGLFMSQLLMTDSLFMKLDYVKNFFSEDTEDDEEEISIDVYVKQKLDELIVEFTEFFKENQKIVNKFVMSAVLSRLPVFFNNVNEVQEYVYNSLDNCTNKAERYAAIGIISSIISDNSK